MSEFEVSRRGFLRLAAVAVTGFLRASVLPEATPQAQASSADRPWTSRRWWPIFPQTATSHDIPRLIDVGGPLHEHDVQAGKEFNYRTYALEEGIEWFNSVINNYPEMKDWAGYCPPLASAGIFEPEPWQGRFLKETKEGLLVAKHAADPMIPLSIEGMRQLLDRGRWTIVNAPTPGEGGNWFRVAYSRSGSTLSVTAWGAGHIPIPEHHVVTAWLPINDPEGVVEVVEGIRNPTEPWRIKQLKMDVIDYIVNS